jgi:hypothetical protein
MLPTTHTHPYNIFDNQTYTTTWNRRVDRLKCYRWFVMKVRTTQRFHATSIPTIMVTTCSENTSTHLRMQWQARAQIVQESARCVDISWAVISELHTNEPYLSIFFIANHNHLLVQMFWHQRHSCDGSVVIHPTLRLSYTCTISIHVVTHACICIQTAVIH